MILGAQARVQKEATAAAGGAVVSSATPSGSTRTTVTGPDVTLNGQLLEQVKMHLAEMRRLLEKKARRACGAPAETPEHSLG